MPAEEKVKVYYLASGHIGIPILKALLESKRLDIAGIGSQKRAARENAPVRSSVSPLMKYCIDNGLQVDGLAKVNTEEFRGMLRDKGVELLVVASFGQILRPELLAIPRFGCLNVHASLLPKYRGASPIVAAIYNGDSRTGVSFMEMEEGLDTGGVYRTAELEIAADDNAATLEEKLGILAGRNIEDVIVDIARHGLKPVPQRAEGASYARKISKEDSWVRWERGAVEIANMVRAYADWPSTRILLPARDGGRRMAKIIKADPVESECPDAAPGTILRADKSGIAVACGKGALLIARLLPEGKKEMDAGDYLRGYPIPPEHPFMYEP